jgi:hypothetical protein
LEDGRILGPFVVGQGDQLGYDFGRLGVIIGEGKRQSAAML